MNLSEALDKIAAYLNLNADELRAYAGEDHIGGYHETATEATYPMGSIWGVEGQVLYALVRALKPDRIFEIGYFHGASLSHIAEAVMANGVGQIETVDNYPMQEIPARYWGVAQLRRADIFTYEWQPYDFVFEDAMHSEEMTAVSWQAFAHTAPKGAVIISHDAEHFLVGDSVKRGIESVTKDYLSLLIEPGKCGLAIWRKP